MIEFSNLITVQLLGGSKPSYTFLADSFTFEPSLQEENGGVYWDCDKTFYVDMPDSDAISALRIPRNAIVSLSDVHRTYIGLASDSHRTGAEAVPKVYRVGTEGVPARVQLVSHLNKATLQVKCKMLQNPLS
nr:MAG TPA: hypothetical protein [Caudoviricetes sp.]